MGNTMWQAVADHSYRGHDHFWQRAMSRRQFLGTSAGATAAMATSALWFPVLADASGRDPRHIPGGFVPNLYHAFLGLGVEPSTIFDYRGTTGVATVRGTGTGLDTETGKSTPLLFDSDNRFMRGEYISQNGQRHEGTFGFV
jgi:TAT (twin-arginine translocation) pathway signal sequence